MMQRGGLDIFSGKGLGVQDFQGEERLRFCSSFLLI